MKLKADSVDVSTLAQSRFVQDIATNIQSGSDKSRDNFVVLYDSMVAQFGTTKSAIAEGKTAVIESVSQNSQLQLSAINLVTQSINSNVSSGARAAVIPPQPIPFAQTSERVPAKTTSFQ